MNDYVMVFCYENMLTQLPLCDTAKKPLKHKALMGLAVCYQCWRYIRDYSII